MDVDHGQLVGRLLKDCPVVVGLHNLAPVGGRATGGRHGRRLERLAEVCQGLTLRGRSHPGLRPLANLRFEVSRLLPAVFSEPDVAAAGGHSSGNSSPTRAISLAQAIREVSCERGL